MKFITSLLIEQSNDDINAPLIPGGYILLSRKLIESEIWKKPPLYLKVWIYLLSRAQHKDYKKLRRGQLWTSIPEIQTACAWYIGFRKMTPTKAQIFQVLEWLRNPYGKDYRNSCVQGCERDAGATMITTLKATRGLLVTIENYELYQEPKNYEHNGEGNDEKSMEGIRKERIPDTINKNVERMYKNEQKDYSLEISQFRSRYSPSQLKIIEEYLEILRTTRRSGTIAESVVFKIYSEIHKYDPIVVAHACQTIIDKPDLHSKKENYLFGIMRNTQVEDVTRKQAKAVPIDFMKGL